jgi:hypothetical protein
MTARLLRAVASLLQLSGRCREGEPAAAQVPAVGHLRPVPAMVMMSGCDFTCDDCGVCTHETDEWYMLKDAVWEAVAGDEVLCIGCVERRLGRELELCDFAEMEMNISDNQSERLRDRLSRHPSVPLPDLPRARACVRGRCPAGLAADRLLTPRAAVLAADEHSRACCARAIDWRRDAGWNFTRAARSFWRVTANLLSGSLHSRVDSR